MPAALRENACETRILQPYPRQVEGAVRRQPRARLDAIDGRHVQNRKRFRIADASGAGRGPL